MVLLQLVDSLQNLFGETVAVDLNERFVGVKLNVRKVRV